MDRGNPWWRDRSQSSSIKREDVPRSLYCEHLRRGAVSCEEHCYTPWSRPGYFKCSNVSSCLGHDLRCGPGCFPTRARVYRLQIPLGDWKALHEAAASALLAASRSALDIIMDFWPVRKMNNATIYNLRAHYASFPSGIAGVDRKAITDKDYVGRMLDRFRWPQCEHDLWSYDLVPRRSEMPWTKYLPGGYLERVEKEEKGHTDMTEN
jgi:hypothetical protein